MAARAPPCLGCGACCFSNLDEYVRVNGDDHSRLGERAPLLTRFEGNRCYMRMQDGHCIALVVDAETARFVCSIYDTRPQICRDLGRESLECQAELHEKSARPEAALVVLRSRS